eukprot:m.267676 g.267676  ORF g.267676 m.267676 type:complete len:389 (-) comp74340_c0_seq1:166-1332(-)
MNRPTFTSHHFLCVFGLQIFASVCTGTNWTAMVVDVNTIAAIPDSQCALRNLYISDTYQRLSLAFKNLTHVSQQSQPTTTTQMNWCTLATWASNSVGDNIRNQTLQLLVEELFAAYPPWVRDMIDELGPDWMVKIPVVRDLFARMGKGLCAGNLVVFSEIGNKFAAFGEYFASDTIRNDTSWQRYLTTFNMTYEQNLADAMSHYYDSMWTSNDAERAQQIAWANMLVGLAEQTELQPYIVSAFPPPFNLTWKGKTILIDLSPACTTIISLVTATRWLIPIRDVPPRPDGGVWSSYLDTFNKAPGATQLYDQLVTSAGGGPVFNNTAVTDWSSLKQRMRYIVPAMRSIQDLTSLDCPVLSPSNLAKMRAGIVPPQHEMCYANCCQHQRT